MNRRLDTNDGAVLLGMAMLIFSMVGLYIDSSPALALRIPFGQADEQPGNVLRRVYQGAAAPLPTLAPFTPAPTTSSAPTGSAAPAGAFDSGGSFLVPGTPLPTFTPIQPGGADQPPAVEPPADLAPQRIVIPAIQLDAPVIPAGYTLVDIDGQVYQQWDAPMEYAAGWQQTSAMLGVPGNTVLNGHHNIYGMVFAHLVDLREGDAIQVYSGDWVISYEVTNKMILPERYESLSVRLENGRWMLPTTDERLTLVTCWPPDSNTHRLFIVARPVQKQVAPDH